MSAIFVGKVINFATFIFSLEEANVNMGKTSMNHLMYSVVALICAVDI